MHAIFFLINTPETKNIRIREYKKKEQILSRSILVVTKHACKLSYVSEKIMSLFYLFGYVFSIHNDRLSNNLKKIE
jgi:hypothetical protein